MDIPILIQKSRGSQYGVTVPDIPGCVSTGETIDHAMRNVTDAIYGHLGSLLQQGKPFEIKPSPPDFIASLGSQHLLRADGIAIFLSAHTVGVPNALLHARAGPCWPR